MHRSARRSDGPPPRTSTAAAPVSLVSARLAVVPELHHVLVDAGPSETIETLVPELERRISKLPGTTDRIELLAMSHIDAEHVQGVVALLSDPRRIELFRDVWFNGWKHLPTPPTRNAPDGERLTAIPRRASGPLEHGIRGRASGAAGRDRPSADPPYRRPRTQASNSRSCRRPRRAWSDSCPNGNGNARRPVCCPGTGPRCRARGGAPTSSTGTSTSLASGPYRPDRAEANGSSIAFIAAYGGKSLLCAGDAHSDVVEQGLQRLGSGPHEFTAVKLSHHGSSANLSPSLLSRIRSRNWLISTNGARFGHPDPEALARVITTQRRPVFHLNYVTPHVQEIIAEAGDRYDVELPRKRPGGSYESGVVIPLG